MSTVASLPPVTGQHRNHALAAARRTKAVQLRTDGWTYEAIARELGYSGRGAVHNIVAVALKTCTTEAVETCSTSKAHGWTHCSRPYGPRPWRATYRRSPP